MKRPRSSRAGMGLIEILIAFTILIILVQKATMFLNAASDISTEQTAGVVLEDQARRVLHQIAMAIMSSDRDTLMPAMPNPIGSDEVFYRINLGVDSGEVVWSDREMIGTEEISRLVWAQNPEAENERRILWSKLVSPYMAGELPNGMDDNGNGLIDEKGLSFALDRDAITIRLTLERVDENGETHAEAVQTTVTCRNFTSASGAGA